jgi:hypothetical protein
MTKMTTKMLSSRWEQEVGKLVNEDAEKLRSSFGKMET